MAILICCAYGELLFCFKRHGDGVWIFPHSSLCFTPVAGGRLAVRRTDRSDRSTECNIKEVRIGDIVLRRRNGSVHCFNCSPRPSYIVFRLFVAVKLIKNVGRSPPGIRCGDRIRCLCRGFLEQHKGRLEIVAGLQRHPDLIFLDRGHCTLRKLFNGKHSPG